jgi:hypothetical protein
MATHLFNKFGDVALQFHKLANEARLAGRLDVANEASARAITIEEMTALLNGGVFDKIGRDGQGSLDEAAMSAFEEDCLAYYSDGNTPPL